MLAFVWSINLPIKFQQCGYCSMNISNTHTYNTPASQHKMLSNTSSRSVVSLKKKKLLPHIQQQYSFRITNRLLIYKIMHPKRDKNIVDSLLHTSLTHNLNTHSQISALGSQCRKNMGTKKQYPTQRPLFQLENESAVFVQNRSVFKAQNEKESDCNRQNDRAHTNTEMVNQDRRQPTNSNRERRAGRIMKNNFLGLNTLESIPPEKSAAVEGAFKMQQKQGKAGVGEIMERTGKLRRNLRGKVNYSIEQCQ